MAAGLLWGRGRGRSQRRTADLGWFVNIKTRANRVGISATTRKRVSEGLLFCGYSCLQLWRTQTAKIK